MSFTSSSYKKCDIFGEKNAITQAEQFITIYLPKTCKSLFQQKDNFRAGAGLDGQIHTAKWRAVGCRMLLPMNHRFRWRSWAFLTPTFRHQTCHNPEQPPEPEQAVMASKSTACWNAYRYPQGNHLVKAKNSHCGRSLIHCDCPKRAFPSQVMAKCCSETFSGHSLKEAEMLSAGEPLASRPELY